MVDRLINKIENKPPDFERVESSSEAKKDKRHDQQTAEEKVAKFNKENKTSQRWEKYGAKKITIKPHKVNRQQIANIINKRALWTKGVSMLVVDVKWANGNTTENAVIRLKSINEYMRAKGIPAGEEVPKDLWEADVIEIGIPTVIGSSGVHSMEELERGIIENTEKKKNFYGDSIPWELVGFIALGVVLFILILFYALRG